MIIYTQEIERLELIRAELNSMQLSFGMDKPFFEKRFLKIKFALIDLIDELKRLQGK